jgi:mitogen-activated protein kinase organizer 1
VRLWNPTRIDPAYRPPLSTTKLSSQEYYARQYSHSYGLDEERSDVVKQQQQQQQLPSALPIQIYSEGHVHPVHAIATNSSSTILLSSSDKTLIATNLVTAQTVQKFWGHTARIEYVTCLGGGGGGDYDSNLGEEIFASASYDATVRLWDARSKSKDPLMILNDAKDSVSCISSGKGKGGVAQIITSSIDGKIRTYDLRIGQLITEDISHPITSFAISNDGISIAASCLDGIIRLFNRHSSNLLDRFDARKKVFQKFHTFHKSGNYKLECAITSNDEYLISGSECGAVVVYPFKRQEGRPNTPTVLRRHSNAPTCSVTTCPQISRPWLIASASYDGSAVVWVSEEEAHRCLLDG